MCRGEMGYWMVGVLRILYDLVVSSEDLKAMEVVGTGLLKVVGVVGSLAEMSV